MAYCNSTNTLTKIDYITLFPNPEDVNYNTCLMLCRDSDSKKFFVYSEKVRKEINISLIEQGVETWYLTELQKNCKLEFEILPIGQEKIFFQIISLDKPKSDTKEMTISEIEKKLGHKVKIKNG